MIEKTVHNGHLIEYLDETHQYLVDGILVKSVSEILHKYIFKDKYKGIPENILKAKAIYGSEVHKAIEDIENNREYETTSIYQELSIEQYIKLKKEYNIQVLEQEKIVCYKGIYAGRFDMTANVNNEVSLIDIKTTAQLDLEYLSWQLSLYELAYGKRFKKIYALWLPKKGLGQLVEIKRKSKKEIEKLLKEIENDTVKKRRYSKS